MKYILLPLTFIAFCLNSQAQDVASNTNSSKDNSLYYFSSDSIKSANDTVKRRKGQELKEVVVTANKQPKPVSALRSGLKPMDTPQSVQVIGSEVIEQQQAIRLSDVIKNANGVYVGSARGGANEALWSRGYSMDANNMFKNGFRYNAGSIPDVASLDRVEFLKGGSALLYGNVTPGGILNLVTKTPKFTEGGQLTMQMGSYAFYKPSIDFYGPINKSIAYRFNVSYENSESFRDFVKNERIYLNPSFLFKISDKTQITAQGDYLSADWIPDFGTGIVGKEILDIPRNVYYGALWSTGNTKSASASILVNHDFNDNWKLGFNSSYQSYHRTQKSTAQLSNLAYTDNNGVQEVNWKRGLTQADAAEKIFADQLSLQGTFNTGSIKHQIFTGADYENSMLPSYTFGFYDPKANPANLITTEAKAINLFNYDYNTQSLDVPFSSRITQLGTTETQRFGVFAQDLISINSYIKVLAGLRWSWQESDVTTTKEVIEKIDNVNILTTTYENAIPTTGTRNFNKAFSPKAGLVIQPNKDLSLFASYSNSFTPNTGTTVDLQPLDPSIIDQYEAGIKKDFWKGALSTNITVYQISNNNFAQTVAFKADGITPNVDTNLKELGGSTKGKGIEIDITARPTEGLNVIAGYSFNETKVTKSSGTLNALVVGDILARTPKHTANLSFFYKLPSGVLKGLTFGAIGNYIGERSGGWNDRYIRREITPSTSPKTYYLDKFDIEDRDIPLKGYATVDASVGYDWTKFSILCKVSNITNELNYTVHENYSVNPIAPRQVMVSLKYKL